MHFTTSLTCKITENCITKGWSNPFSMTLPFERLEVGNGVSLSWWFGDPCGSSSACGLDILLDVLVTLNSCNVELSCLLPLVTIPWRATGCWGMSIFTAPTVRKPEFLSFWRLLTLEYRVCDFPKKTWNFIQNSKSISFKSCFQSMEVEVKVELKMAQNSVKKHDFWGC